MRWSPLTTTIVGVEDADHVIPGRCRSGRVRLSILSRELLILGAVLAGVGYLVVEVCGLDQGHQAGKSTLRGHDGVIESLAFEADGKRLISCGWDRSVRAWVVEQGRPDWGQEIESLPNASHLFSVAVSRDGKYLAAGGTDSLHLWSRDSEDGWNPVEQDDRGSHHTLTMAPDSSTLAMGCANGSIKLWDMSRRKELKVLGGFDDELRKVEFSPDGTYLAGTAFSGDFKAWEISPEGSSRASQLAPEHVQMFAFGADGRTVVIAQWSPEMKALGLWDRQTGKRLMQLSENETGVNALVVSPDGRTLASADVDQSIRLWDLASGKLMARIHDGVGWVKTLAFSPDGRRIAFGGRDGSVQIRDLDSASLPGESSRS